MKPTGQCRSCGRPITWVISGGKGNRMPLDPEPVADGNVWIIEEREHAPAIIGVALHHDDIPAGVVTYVTHRVSCEYAAEQRRPRR